MGEILLHRRGPGVTHPDRLDRVRLALALNAVATTHTPTPECLDDDTVAALADGSLDPATRAAVLPHVAGCARCRTAVASVARALADPGLASEMASLAGTRRRRPLRLGWIALPLAAAAGLVLLLARPWVPEDGGLLHRAPTITATPAPLPVSPVGVVAEARRLVWMPAAGADRYRVTLFDREGVVVYETELVDTTAALPDSVIVAPGRLYLWKVEARTGIGRWTGSELVEFSLPPSSPPR